MTKGELHDLVDRLPDRAVDGAALLLEEIADGRIDPDQAWFWTREWQEKEREVDESIARGERGTVYESDEAFLSALEALTYAEPPSRSLASSASMSALTNRRKRPSLM